MPHGHFRDSPMIMSKLKRSASRAQAHTSASERAITTYRDECLDLAPECGSFFILGACRRRTPRARSDCRGVVSKSSLMSPCLRVAFRSATGPSTFAVGMLRDVLKNALGHKSPRTLRGLRFAVEASVVANGFGTTEKLPTSTCRTPAVTTWLISLPSHHLKTPTSDCDSGPHIRPKLGPGPHSQRPKCGM